ncbi:MAG: hypothetical protein NZ602_07660 [Thermoguttaceae bacterium]|nr:hypothetical protein [Thermoguttaceae bacterium]MDW8038106.1 type III-B CRISPR module-associated Cmr3 family protein [Thermoguttaceae bacterium]
MSQQENAAASLERIGLWLEPLDVLLFRDGRPFSAASRVRSGPPMPQTLAGALWTAFLRQAGCHFPTLTAKIKEYQKKRTESEQEQSAPGELLRQHNARVLREAIRAAGGPDWIFQVHVRGPWLARIRQEQSQGPLSRAEPTSAPAPTSQAAKFAYPVLARPDKSQPIELFVAMPAVLYKSKKGKGSSNASETKNLVYAKPLSAEWTVRLGQAWQPPAKTALGLRPVWIATREDMEVATGYLPLEALDRFLQGQAPEASQIVPEEELFGHDHRTGIGIEMDRLISEEGQIYAISLLALQKGVGFYAEVLLPPEGAQALRQIHCLRWGGESRNVLLHVLQQPCRWPNHQPTDGQKPLLLLTTPGLFQQGWLPSCLQEHLVAAAVPGETAVSGWDLARGGPKPARFAAAAGSVYFLEKIPDQLPEALSDLEEDRQQGWGCFVQGVWTDD